MRRRTIKEMSKWLKKINDWEFKFHKRNKYSHLILGICVYTPLIILMKILN